VLSDVAVDHARIIASCDFLLTLLFKPRHRFAE
jgi:hypothetical protein